MTERRTVRYADLWTSEQLELLQTWEPGQPPPPEEGVEVRYRNEMKLNVQLPLLLGEIDQAEARFRAGELVDRRARALEKIASHTKKD